MSENLYRTLATRWTTPGAPFLLQPDGSVLAYRDLPLRTAQLARALLAHGVQPGDRVAVQAEKSATGVLLYLACLRAGAVYLPLNPAYTRGEMQYFLQDAQAALLVCRPTDVDVMRGIDRSGRSVLTLDADGSGTLQAAAATQPPEFDDVAVRVDALAALLYTSGTTGRSKGAMLTHGNLHSNALTLVKQWRFTAQDRLLHGLPIFHIHGLFVAINVTLASGAAMHFLPRFDVDAVLNVLPRCTAMMGVPTFYTRLLADPRFDRARTQHMRLFVSGSAPLLATTHAEFQARTGHAILERYGMTETNMNTSNPYDGPRLPGSVGPPLPGVEIRITDPVTHVPTPGAIGMIEVRGPNVCKGYWRNPEKTAEDFRPDEFFVTGDLGSIDDNGYVWISGRARDLIISGGFNVYPAEVETALDALTGVRESAVIGVPHTDLGEAVVAVIARSDAALTESAVMAGIADQLARFKQPRRVLFVDELPRNTMGKVQKKELREQYAALFTAPMATACCTAP